MDTADAIRQTKENIQPLSTGRITSKIDVALQAQTNTALRHELKKDIANFELKLRMYEGDDPLSPWVEYVSWIEQCFPKGGKEGNLNEVLEKCLTTFKDDVNYMQDSRFIKLWIKFIDMMDDASTRCELYQNCFSHGIGIHSALFFRFWAYELQNCGNDKGANKIYQLGFKQFAQPIEELEKAHSTFLQLVGQRQLMGNDAPPPQRPDLHDQRQVMSTLRPHGGQTRQAPVLRVGGPNVLKVKPGALPLTSSNKQSRGAMSIFNDENECEADVSTATSRMHSLPSKVVTNKENSLQAGPWTGPHRKAKQTQSMAPTEFARPTFSVHSDEPSNAPQMPTAQLGTAHALKTRREEDLPRPLAMFEPPDPTQKPMYPKDKVYAGGKEFSLEELLAAKYFKKIAQNEARGLVKPKIITMKFQHTPPKVNSSIHSQESALNVQSLNAEDSPNVHNEEHTQDPLSGSTLDLQHGNTKPLFFRKPSGSAVPSQRRKSQFFGKIVSKTDPVETAVQDTSKTLMNMNKNNLSHETDKKLSFTQTDTSIPQIGASQPGTDCGSLAVNGPRDLYSQQNDRRGLDPRQHDTYAPITTVQQHPHSVLFHDSKRSTPLSQKFGNEIASLPTVVEPIEKRNVLLHPKTMAQTAGEFSRSPVVKRDASSASESFMSDEHSVLHSQSITANFKEAMYAMNEMWGATESKMASVQLERQNVGVPTVNASLPLTSRVQEPSLKQQVSFTPFKIFSDDLEEPQDLTTDSSKRVTTEQECMTSLAANASRTSSAEYKIYQDEPEDEESFLESVLPPMPSVIPLVPSPGMSSSQIWGLRNTEGKENQLPISFELPDDEPREMAGILEPSLNIPFIPLDENAEYNTVNYATQALSAAFRLDLVASTPFHRHQSSQQYHTDSPPCSDEHTSPEMQTEEISPPQSRDQPSNSQAAFNLSVIMEASKESISSSSSGANTRRTTFGSSHWATTSNATESNTRKSEFRGPQETLPIIEEMNKECDSSATSSKCSEKPDMSIMKAEVFNWNQFASPEPCTSSVNQEIKESVSHKLPVHAQSINDYKDDLFAMDVFNSPCQNLVVSRNVQDKKRFSENYFHSQEVESVSYRRDDSKSKIFISYEEQKENVQYNNYNDSEDSLSEDICDKENILQVYKDPEVSTHELEASVNSLSKSLCELQCHTSEDIDPFNPDLINDLLSKVGIPKERYTRIQRMMPTGFKYGVTLTIESYVFDIYEMLGKGSYAKVIKAVDDTDSCKALKIQKPAWLWELYITAEVQRRLSDKSKLQSYMSVDHCYEYNNGSILISEFAPYGTVLEAASMIRSVPNMRELEPLCIYWTIEMLAIMENLHACGIIHGDVKPDNFVVRSLPMSATPEPMLQLIDFGRAIDMTLLPKGTTFTRVVNTKDFQCVEMQSGRPWTYQTDLFGLASTVHCLLFGDYMKVVLGKNGQWNISKKIPRYFKEDLWSVFFLELLNVESCKKMPDLKKLRLCFEDVWKCTAQNSNCFGFFAKIIKNQQYSKKF